MQRMLAEVVVPETTTKFIETQITNKSLTNILWNILLSILLGLTGQSDLTHLRLVTQPVSRMLSSVPTRYCIDLVGEEMDTPQRLDWQQTQGRYYIELQWLSR